MLRGRLRFGISGSALKVHLAEDGKKVKLKLLNMTLKVADHISSIFYSGKVNVA